MQKAPLTYTQGQSLLASALHRLIPSTHPLSNKDVLSNYNYISIHNIVILCESLGQSQEYCACDADDVSGFQRGAKCDQRRSRFLNRILLAKGER